jgi:pimeloyl-ACP methyl ester carboxylesterase
MGLSSYQPGRSLLDWPDDVAVLADRLRIERFSVVGLSAGGPYAAACAYKIADRLLTCGIVSGVGQVGRFVGFLSHWLPWLLLPVARRMFRDTAHAERSLQRFAGRWPAPDQRSLRQSGIQELLAASLVEGLHQGARGPAYDGMLLAQRSWGFELEAIAFHGVFLWHGQLDREAPIAAARTLAERIPRCKPTYYPHEGHLSVIVNHGEEIVASLMSDRP